MAQDERGTGPVLSGLLDALGSLERSEIFRRLFSEVQRERERRGAELPRAHRSLTAEHLLGAIDRPRRRHVESIAGVQDQPYAILRLVEGRDIEVP